MIRYVMGFRYDGRVLLRQNGNGAPWTGIDGPVLKNEIPRSAMRRIFKAHTGIDARDAGWLKIGQMYNADMILTIFVSHGGFDGLQPDPFGGELRAWDRVPPDVSATSAWVAGLLLDHTLDYMEVHFDRSDT